MKTILGVLAFVLLLVATARSAGFYPLPDGPLDERRSTWFEVKGLSADGTTLVGNLAGEVVRVRTTGGDTQAFSFPWTATGGISSNGDCVVVNSSETFSWNDQPLTFSFAELTKDLKPFFTARRVEDGTGTDVSADGGTMTGTLGENVGFISTSNALQTIDGINPYAISADGQILVGITSTQEAFYWTTNTGVVTLGFLEGATNSIATAISGDNQTIVGMSGGRAFRWTALNGMEALGDLPGFSTSASSVSYDGSIILGTRFSSLSAEAMIWDGVHGPQRLKDRLQASGVDLTGWQLRSGVDISSDGKIVIGNGRNPQGHSQAWSADLGELLPPSTLSASITRVGFPWKIPAINVNWDRVTRAEGYALERKESTDGSWHELALLPKETTNYLDFNTSDTTYFYRVRSANLGGRSAPSVEASESGYRRFVFQNTANGTLQIWQANGTKLESAASIASEVSLSDWRAVCLEDFNRDDHFDILMQRANGQIGILYLEGTNAANVSLLNNGQSVNNAWRLKGTCDGNNDGKLDFLWQHRDGYVAEWLMDGTNFVQRKVILGGRPMTGDWRLVEPGTYYHFYSTSNATVVAEYPEFFVQNKDGRLAKWYLKAFTFASAQSFGSLPLGWRATGMVDLNHDYDPDVVAQYADGRVGVWYIRSRPTPRMTGEALLFDGKSPGAQWRLIGVYP